MIDLLQKSTGDGQPADGDRQVPGNEAAIPVQGISQPLQQENFALRIGEYTRVLVDDAGYLLEQAMRSLNGLVLVARGDIPVKWDRVEDIAIQVGIVLLAAYLGFLPAS